MKAKEEGFDTVVKMFEATSKAEAIHAENHKKVLEKLGEKVEAPVIGAFETKTTLENLADALEQAFFEYEPLRVPPSLLVMIEPRAANARMPG